TVGDRPGRAAVVRARPAGRARGRRAAFVDRPAGAGRVRAAPIRERSDLLRAGGAQRLQRALPALVQLAAGRPVGRIRPGPAVAVRPVLWLYAELGLGPVRGVQAVPRHQLPAVAVLEMGAW